MIAALYILVTVTVRFVTAGIDLLAYCEPNNTCNSTGSLGGKSCFYGAVPDWVNIYIYIYICHSFIAKIFSLSVFVKLLEQLLKGI